MHWSEKYLNIPYKDKNCAEFVEFVLSKEFKINFKFPQSHGSFFEQSALIKKSINDFVYPEKTDEPKEGDLVLMNGSRRICHVGLFVKIRNIAYVLHNQKQHSYSRLHRIDHLPYNGLLLEGIYKWQK